jgi:hypothetical protein
MWRTLLMQRDFDIGIGKSRKSDKILTTHFLIPVL